MKRVLSLASWLIPPVLLFVLYSYSLRTWFQQDDFAWLGMARSVSSWGDVLRGMFTPTSHGTFRPFSERGFFLAFYHLFGLDALPWRIWVFATQTGSLLLLNALVRRMTGSPAAGFWAAMFWVANARLATALSWTSAYMQVLCGLFLLLELYLWLRHTETGRRRYWAGLLAVFALGFGVLETNVVFPVMAALYAHFLAPAYFRKALLLLVPSAVFVGLHMYFAPKQPSGPYAMHFDLGILNSLAQYWRWSVNPDNLVGFRLIPVAAGRFGLWLITAGLAGFVAWSAWRRCWLPLVLAGWYLTLLAPVLPLRDHVIEYYVTLPVMVLSILGAWALVSALRAGWLWRGVAVAAAAIFLLISAPAARQNSKNRFHYGRAVEKMVLGVARARQLHPSRTILLDGATTDLFWGGVCDNAFQSVGVYDVYLTPGSEAHIGGDTGLCPPSGFILPYAATLRGLDAGKLVVYSLKGERLKNVTRSYTPPASARGAATGFRLDVASRAADVLLGPTWYEGANGLRWMPKKAGLLMPVAARSGQKLYIVGSCTDRQMREGPLELTVSLSGKLLNPVRIDRAGVFHLDFEIPADVAGREGLEVGLEVSRTFRLPGESRELGLVFGTFEIR